MQWQSTWTSHDIFDENAKLCLPAWDTLATPPPAYPHVNLDDPHLPHRLQDRHLAPWSDDEAWDRVAIIAAAGQAAEAALSQPQPAPAPAPPPPTRTPATNSPAPQPTTAAANRPHQNAPVLAMPVNEWRDLAGDARTTQTQSPGHPPQCILASMRNISRRGLLTEDELIQRYAMPGGGGDIYSINHAAALSDLACNPDECALAVPLRGPRAITLSDDVCSQIYSATAVVTGAYGWCTHVVALIQMRNQHAPKFRLYDNDSRARTQGTFSIITAEWIRTHAQILTAVTPADGPLAGIIRGLGPSTLGSTQHLAGFVAVPLDS